MGFAIPSSTAKDILDNLMTKQTRIAVGEDAQGYLGIRVTNIDAATSQAYGDAGRRLRLSDYARKEPQPTPT